MWMQSEILSEGVWKSPSEDVPKNMVFHAHRYKESYRRIQIEHKFIPADVEFLVSAINYDHINVLHLFWDILFIRNFSFGFRGFSILFLVTVLMLLNIVILANYTISSSKKVLGKTDPFGTIVNLKKTPTNSRTCFRKFKNFGKTQLKIF